MSRFHRYSLNNTVLIAMQNPEASLVAGYHAWQTKFERHVCKGEQAIRIIAPVEEKRLVEKEKLDPQTKRPVLDAQGKPVMEETEVTVKRFRVVPVFDVSQTEGKELPSLAKELQGNVADYDLLFEAMKSVSPVPIEFKAMKAGKDGYYHLKDKKIALRQGMSEIQTVATAIHEISHAKLHDRDLQQRGAKDTEKVKDSRTQEVEAESIAYAVCQYYGIETADNSFGYLAGWSSDKDLSELKASLQTIRDTASELITSIDEKVFNLKQEFEIEAPKTGKPRSRPSMARWPLWLKPWKTISLKRSLQGKLVWRTVKFVPGWKQSCAKIAAPIPPRPPNCCSRSTKFRKILPAIYWRMGKGSPSCVKASNGTTASKTACKPQSLKGSFLNPI